jgi:DNA-binding IclR family transcriptional regulator
MLAYCREAAAPKKSEKTTMRTTGVAAPIFDSKDVILGSLSVTVGQSSLAPDRVAFIVDRVSFGARIVSKAIARGS